MLQRSYLGSLVDLKEKIDTLAPANILKPHDSRTKKEEVTDEMFHIVTHIIHTYPNYNLSSGYQNAEA